MEKQKVAIIILLGLLLIFVFTAPKISSRLFPFKRAMMLQGFINTVKKNNDLDTQKFLEFREFYYPGYITFNKKGYSHNDIAPFLQKINVPLNPQARLFPFLVFHSDKFLSIEYLVQTNKLSDLLGNLHLSTNQVLFQDPSTYMYADGKDIKIIFLRTDSQMVLANGFLSPLDKHDRPLYQGKHWFVISAVSRD